MLQRTFEPIYPNPYIAGNPIRNQEMFFGRVDEFRFIARALEDGRKAALIVLFGERRSGKSSILYQILNGRLGEAFLPIFVDMQIMAGIAGDADFFERIITDACKQLAGNGLSAEPYASQLKEAAATNVFRRFLQEVKSRFPERAPLLLVDEYENLEARVKEGSLSRHILTFFAGLLETDLVSFVFTGSRSLEVHDQAIWGEELFRKATSRKISFLTKDDTTRLITQPLQNKVDFAPEVVAQIYSLTAGQPFYTQMICQNLVYHLNEVQKRHVTRRDLQDVVDGVLENPPPQLIFNWSEHAAERKLALSLLAEFSEAPQTFLSARDLCQGIKRKKLEIDLAPNFFHAEFSSLFQDEYVLQKARKYGFRLDLYRLWVRHDHNIWQVKKEIGARETARITKQAHIKEKNRQRTFRRLEHAIAIGLAVVVIYVLWKLLFPPKHVIVQANGGPFWVLVDSDTVGTSHGQKDSTRFEMPEALTKGIAYEFKVILAASGETWQKTETIQKDDHVVEARFPLYPLQVITDAASVEMRVGGLPSVKTADNQPEAWQHKFQVCAGKYVLWAKDRSTGEVSQIEITVSDTMAVRIDFPGVVVLTLAANHYPFDYTHKWRNARASKERPNLKRANSPVVFYGQPKDTYLFTFSNPVTGQPINIISDIKTDTTVSVKFDPDWKPPQPPVSVTMPKTITKHTLRINSVPSGASLSLNGKERGVTPFIDYLERSEYLIILKMAGYDSAKRQIVLTSDFGDTIKLTPQNGHLKLVVQDEKQRLMPNYAVSVDGRPLTERELRSETIQLPVGKRTLRIESRRYASIDTFCVIEKNKIGELRIIMERSKP
ncbi:PEGA domain-containing protein [candidate division KSB1 bacterium]|nr:PEGA domain-containing protein [candidate division KSB1 bacterium]